MALENLAKRLFPRSISGRVLLWSVLGVALVVLVELIGIVGFQIYGDRILRDELSRTAEVGAASFDGRDLARLNGVPEDSGKVEFAVAREVLSHILTAMPDSRFAYLLGERRGEIVFLADATPETSPDYSAPGDPYDEASLALRQSFLDGTSLVEGPISDRWGTWVSAVAVIRNADDGSIAAVLGIDFDAGHWQQKLAGFRWFGTAVGAAVVCVGLLLGVLLYRQHRLAAGMRLANHIIESSSTIVYRVAAEPGFPMTFISDNVRRLGYEAHEILASPVIYRGLIHPDDQPLVEESFRELMESKDGLTTQIRAKTKDGDYRWVESRIIPLRDASGRLIAAEGTLTDITEARELESRIRFTNTVLATEMETSPDAILVVDELGRAISHNRRFLEMWGIPKEMIEAGDDAPMVALVTGAMKEPEKFLARVQHLYAHKTEVGKDELETKDGRFIERYSSPLTDGDTYLGRVWFFHDVTEARQAEAKIRHSAGHDALTGLPNRRTFLEAVTEALARTHRSERNFAILFLDLDHFKDVNDTLGHPAGDELLCAVADRLGESVRSTDLVSRFGGDEFAVLMTSIGEPSDAATLADKLIAVIARPFSIGGDEVRTGASIGIVVREADEDDSEALLSHADVALYRAKAEGRGGYRFFTDAMDIDVRRRVTMSAELREAIANDHLFLEYQPQVEVETGRIVGLEALVRWNHPARGVVCPTEFVPIAEKTGLIGALGQWVLAAACQQINSWHEAGVAVPRVAVNVSSLQFKMANELEDLIARTLAARGLPAQALEIELTETAIMAVSQDHDDALQRMQNGGLTFAIDDFGTGYSSLSYLRRFPVDRIKIAQEFVKLILVDPGSAAIVRATIALAKELDVVVLAEGVESLEQLDLLRKWGCPEVQGYCYSPPLASDAVGALLLQGRIVPSRQPMLVAVA